MDPDQMLKDIREWIDECRKGSPDKNYYERRIRHTLEDLDHWLSNGGFLPKEWSNG